MTAELPLPSALPPVTFVGAGKLGTAVAEAWEQRGGAVAARVTAADTRSLRTGLRSHGA